MKSDIARRRMIRIFGNRRYKKKLAKLINKPEALEEFLNLFDI